MCVVTTKGCTRTYLEEGCRVIDALGGGKYILVYAAAEVSGIGVLDLVCEYICVTCTIMHEENDGLDWIGLGWTGLDWAGLVTDAVD